MRLLILLCTALAVVAKLDLPHPSEIQLESLVPYDAPLDVNGEPTSFAAATVTDGISSANKMDMYCNNKFCSMMEYAVSCKAIGLGIKKICARYLLGYKYGCNIFPDPPEVVNAPSICIPSVLRILPVLAQGAAGLAVLVGPYLNTTDFATDTCGRTCYQNYQNATHDFYANCRPQINSSVVPLAAAISVFQEFRNQACSRNPAGKNCYVSVASLLPTPTPTTTLASVLANFMTITEAEDLLADAERRRATEGVLTATVESADVALQTEAAVEALPEEEQAPGAAPSIDVFNFNCNYGLGTTNNLAVMNGVCKTFSAMGCCAATGITMLQQNPIGGLAAAKNGGTVDPVIFPPCLVKYFKEGNCAPLPNVDMQSYCSNGSIASTTVVTSWMFMPKGTTTPAGVLPFPNMYVKQAVLNLQGAVTGALMSFPGFTAWPYLFNKAAPLQVQVVDYTYYNNSMEAITPSNGVPYQPYGADYTQAKYGNFTFQVVVQDLNATGASVLYAALRSQKFRAGLNIAYSGSQTGTAQVTVQTIPVMYPDQAGPDPLDVSNSAFGLSAFKGSQWFVTLLLTVSVSAALVSSGSRSRGSR